MSASMQFGMKPEDYPPEALQYILKTVRPQVYFVFLVILLGIIEKIIGGII
jgi:hypothetical protein